MLFRSDTRAALEIIPNGVDIADDSPKSVAPTPYVLVLGRISWKKRIERAIAAVAALPNLRLVVAGGDDEGLLPSLQQQVQRLGISDRVEFTGHVDGERKHALIRDASALVMVSLTENYGNVVLEAMALATPVIVVPKIGAADAVRAADGGWVIEDTVAALQQQLQQLLAHPNLGRDAGQRGADWVRTQASWAAIALRMSKLYQRVCHAK